MEGREENKTYGTLVGLLVERCETQRQAAELRLCNEEGEFSFQIDVLHRAVSRELDGKLLLHADLNAGGNRAREIITEDAGNGKKEEGKDPGGREHTVQREEGGQPVQRWRMLRREWTFLQVGHEEPANEDKYMDFDLTTVKSRSCILARS